MRNFGFSQELMESKSLSEERMRGCLCVSDVSTPSLFCFQFETNL